jgi:hypothetical protein
MTTIRQVYENAGMLMKKDRFYEKVRENIELLMMNKIYCGWDSKATKEFIDCIFVMNKLDGESKNEQK